MPPSLILTSAPSASKLISAAASIVKLFADIVKSVPSPSIFSESPPNTIPTLLGICTSLVAVKLILALEAIVKSVPSPSIFSPSSPNVTPIFAPTLISPPEPTVTVKSVPSDSIFSAVAKVNPTPEGILTSAVAVRLILLPEIVKSVPSPSIFSASSPKVIPTLQEH